MAAVRWAELNKREDGEGRLDGYCCCVVALGDQRALQGDTRLFFQQYRRPGILRIERILASEVLLVRGFWGFGRILASDLVLVPGFSGFAKIFASDLVLVPGI